MLHFLLDEHLSPRIARQCRMKWPEMEISSVLTWEEGKLIGVADDDLLMEASRYGWTLVTYDQATIVPLLKKWAEQDVAHGGVIFVDHRTMAPNDLGSLIRALGEIWTQERQSDWRNAVVYLTRPG